LAGFNDLQCRWRASPHCQSGEPGQVRREAATAGLCKCRGSGSPLILFTDELSSTCPQMAAAGLRQPGGARESSGHCGTRSSKTGCITRTLRRYAGGRQDDSRLASWRNASIAKPASRRSPAASARRAWKSTPGASSICSRWTRPPILGSTKCAAARDRAICSEPRALQGVRDRRSAHAVDVGVQRNAEDLEEPARAPEISSWPRTDPQKIPVTVLSRCPAVQPEADAPPPSPRI